MESKDPSDMQIDKSTRLPSKHLFYTQTRFFNMACVYFTRYLIIYTCVWLLCIFLFFYCSLYFVRFFFFFLLYYLCWFSSFFEHPTVKISYFLLLVLPSFFAVNTLCIAFESYLAFCVCVSLPRPFRALFRNAACSVFG